MRVDVWFDIVCPFCHLGHRHLELALEQFEHAAQTEVVWRSFELDPNAEAVGEGNNVDRIAAKYGVPRAQMVAQHEGMAAAAAQVGLDFKWDDIVPSNSFDAHRLLHYARSVGREPQVSERVMRAWYSEGAAIGDHEVLVRLAVEAGLDETAVRELLAGDAFGEDVRADEALARQVGITAVPTFVLDGRYGVQGAQPVEVLLDALRQAWASQT